MDGPSVAIDIEKKIQVRDRVLNEAFALLIMCRYRTVGTNYSYSNE